MKAYRKRITALFAAAIWLFTGQPAGAEALWEGAASCEGWEEETTWEDFAPEGEAGFEQTGGIEGDCAKAEAEKTEETQEEGKEGDLPPESFVSEPAGESFFAEDGETEEYSFEKTYGWEMGEAPLVGASQGVLSFLASEEGQSLISRIRKQMVERNAVIEDNFTLPSALSQEEMDGFSDAIMEELWKETGVSTEGDYLRYSAFRTTLGLKWRNVKKNVPFRLTMTSYYSSSLKEEEMLAYHMQIVKDNLGLDSLETDEEKLRILYTFLTGFVRYDFSHVDDTDYLPQYSAYSALVKGTSVCQGITLLLYRFLTEMGIENRAVIGYVSGGRHIWNLVKIGEKYYYCDATLDLGVGEKSFQYFLVGEQVLSKDHVKREHCAEEAFLQAYPVSAYSYGTPEDAGGLRNPLTMRPDSAKDGYLIEGLSSELNFGGEDIFFTVQGAGADFLYGEDLLPGDEKWTPMGWCLAGKNDVYDIPRDGAFVSSRTYRFPLAAAEGKLGQKAEILLAFARGTWNGTSWEAEEGSDDDIAFVSVPVRIASLRDENPQVVLPVSKLTLYSQGETLREASLAAKTSGVGGTWQVKYVSSNKAAATVTKKGLVKAAAPGKATVTAKLVKDGKTLAKAKCKVTVKKPTLTASALSVKLGKEKTLSVKASPLAEISFESLDPSTASVTADGLVKGLARGKTKIRIQGNGLAKEVTVKVK